MRCSAHGILRECVAFRAFLARADIDEMDEVADDMRRALAAELNGGRPVAPKSIKDTLSSSFGGGGAASSVPLARLYAPWLPELFGAGAPPGLETWSEFQQQQQSLHAASAAGIASAAKERQRADLAAEFEARRARDAAVRSVDGLAQLLETVRASAASRRLASSDRQMLAARFTQLAAAQPDAVFVDMSEQLSGVARHEAADELHSDAVLIDAVRRRLQDAESVVEMFAPRFELAAKLADARRTADEWRTPDALAEHAAGELSERQARNRAEEFAAEHEAAVRLRTVDRMMRVHSLPRATHDARTDFLAALRECATARARVAGEAQRAWLEVVEMATKSV